jgi:membrane complex biogenesis BtpA family protein
MTNLIRRFDSSSIATIGMVHLRPLPGTPRSAQSPEAIASKAVQEARMLAEAGFDAVLVENMHDLPYLLRSVGPEIVAAMTLATKAVVDAVDVPVGVQILAGANREAISVAYAAGAQFIRAEGFAYASVADEGIFAEADAGPLLRFRRAIGAEEVAIWADVRKKHSAHALTADLSITDLVSGTHFAGADAVIITGPHTGSPASEDDIDAAEAASPLPVMVGSGVTHESVRGLLSRASGVIVGSELKVDGRWENELDPERISRFIKARHAG